jgi:predicted acyltransferase
MGVLQRIALAYGFAAIIVHLAKWKGARIISIALLLGYWLLCLATNPADPYSISGWFGTAVDKAILGESHMYHGEGIAFDPEGLMSLPAAIVQVIIGFMAGDYIRRKGKTQDMLNGLFVAGLAMVFAGFVWDMFFPINKKIWTSSYTIYTSGLAMLILGLLIWLVEFNNKRGRWSRFFVVFGKNAQFIFVLSGVFPRTMALIRIPNGVNDAGKQLYLSPLSWFYEKICKPLFEDPRNASLLYAICFIIFMWFLAWLMDRKKWYVRV